MGTLYLVDHGIKIRLSLIFQHLKQQTNLLLHFHIVSLIVVYTHIQLMELMQVYPI